MTSVPALGAVTPAEVEEFLAGKSWISEQSPAGEIDKILRANLPKSGLELASKQLAARHRISQAAASLLLEAEIRRQRVTESPQIDTDRSKLSQVTELQHRAASLQPELEWPWRESLGCTWRVARHPRCWLRLAIE